MSTYKEVIYMILDALKIQSDDSYFQEEHVLFLLDKYRALLLKQNYKDIKKEIPESNFQTICLDLEQVPAINGIPCEGKDYMKSIQEIPYLIKVGNPKLTSLDYFQGNFAFINNERFKYVNHNKFLKNQVYGTIAPDNHLYMKSGNPQVYYLQKVKLTGVFEDSRKAAAPELQCGEDAICDVLDNVFPLEEGLIQPLIQLIIQDLSKYVAIPEDTLNNSTDDKAPDTQEVQNIRSR